MFRELTRKKQQLSREECVDILINETRGVLSVMGDGGYPYGMPMNHFYNPDDGKIYFHCGRSGHRTDSVKKNGKVSLCVSDRGERREGDWAWTVKSVIVFGTAEIIDDTDKVIDITRRLCYKFTRDEEYIKDETEKYLSGTVLLVLTPEHICGKRVTEA
ncbi:MAG: pyridoxamine 5'-phosphate oxidase family protein [Clostridia bacterium]|nr:pyridoxamine 5'-phosphate oxidase family protein [Clostridia bacterium]